MARDRAQESLERLLRDAGLAPGMRVLDVGCGYGTVSATIARMVGDGGAVIGLDHDEAALSVAAGRMQALGIHNATFVACDLASPPAGLGVDAIVGRRVLMYVADRDAALRGLLEALRPGGVVIFQETDGSQVPQANVPLPLHERVHRWIWQTVLREGATPTMGFELAPLLERAGLVLAEIRAESIVQTGTIRFDTATIVRAILARIVGQGVATESEIDIDTLDLRLEDELVRSGGSFVGDVFFSAWARKPPGAG